MRSSTFSCPGCSELVTVESSQPVDIEWERYVVRGGYLGWLICATHEVIDRLEIDMAESAGSWAFVGGGDFFGQRLTCVHECSGGGHASDRAPVTPAPPSRQFRTEPQGSAETAT
jgi:hypothetical protein